MFKRLGLDYKAFSFWFDIFTQTHVREKNNPFYERKSKYAVV